MVDDRSPQDTSPDEFPQTTPRDLHPTSDIRFVMLSIGELGAKVDALIKSSDEHGPKIDDLRQKVSFVKGAMWVFGAILAVLAVIVGYYLAGNLSITVTPG